MKDMNIETIKSVYFIGAGGIGFDVAELLTHAADDEDGRVHSRDPDGGRKAQDVRTTGRAAASGAGRVMAILVPGPASNRPAWSERKNTGDRAAKRPSSSGWPFCLQINDLPECAVERAMGIEPTS